MVASQPQPSPLRPPPLTSLLPVPPSALTSFLPLTLTAIRERPALGALGGRAVAAEVAAGDSWQALLGDCTCERRRRFPRELHKLSEAAGAAAGDWWRGRGSTHRRRVTEFERWAADALHEGDGAEFAVACARYDAALAHALVTAPVPA
jgi:hypothetical protein